MTLLSIENVTRDYPVRGGTGRGTRVLRALRGVDLSIARGEIVGLVGESGCGKSTLARLLLGIEEPSSGSVLINDRPISGYGRLERAALIQPVFQDPYSSLNPRMTIGSIIGAPLEVRGIGTGRSRRERVRELMSAVGLPDAYVDIFPNQLSGGQRQRVAIARALIGEPEILICDEPTSALDVSVQSQVLNLIAELKVRLDLTIVLISHNLAVIHHLADRVAVMYLGRLVEVGATDEVFAAPRHPYTRALMEAVLAPEPGRTLPDIDCFGELPSPLDPPPGCAFHPRCPEAQATCARETPRVCLEGSHRFSCHFPLQAP